jgi:hypothetical protein
MPVILATWETDIRRITFQSQPAWSNSSPDPISKIRNTKKDWWSGSNVRVSVLYSNLSTQKKKKKRKKEKEKEKRRKDL